jgi:diacylglycerol kinase
MKSTDFSPARRWKSFGHAFRGLAFLLRTQPHARLHALATAVVVALGFWFDVPRGEWLALVLAMGLVWLAEAMNTALETLADAVHPEQHPLVGRAKDVAAAGALMSALAALVVGLLIFVPRL